VICEKNIEALSVRGRELQVPTDAPRTRVLDVSRHLLELGHGAALDAFLARIFLCLGINRHLGEPIND
jgi:hypothetical protein